ncbi:hypothetical protein AAVH_15305 [Aphelenchoides avenae]|nr:hypothetical protein AAVH_15305 [Aphelenchus avenae]
MKKKSAPGSLDHPSFDKRPNPTRNNGRKQALNKLNLAEIVNERHDTESIDDVSLYTSDTLIPVKPAGPTCFALSEFVINKQKSREIKMQKAEATTDDWVVMNLETHEKCTSQLKPTSSRQGQEALNDKVSRPATSHSLANALDFEWIDNRPTDFEDFELVDT